MHKAKRIKVREVRGVNKVLGLINAQKPENLLIKTRFGIHTFGLRLPIDVIVLNNKNRVVKLKESLKPNNIFIWNPKHDTVVELPASSIKKLHITLGASIRFT